MRWLTRLIVTLFLLAFLLVAGLLLMPTEQIARLAAERFEAATGRALVISGGVQPTFYPVIGARTGQVEVANAAWASDQPMLRAEALEIGLDLAALWRGEVAIRRIELQSPEILLERNAGGEGNWAFAQAAGQPASSEGGSEQLRPLTIDAALINDGRLTYLDHGTGTRYEARALDLRLALPEATGPADLELSAVVNGEPLALKASIAEPVAFLSGDVGAVELRAALAGATLSFAGRMATMPLAGEGRLEADVPDPARVAATVGQPMPLPAPMALEGDVTLTPEGTAHLRAGQISLAENVLTVTGDLVAGDTRPRVTAQVTAGDLRLPASASQAETGAGAGREGWSTAPIDVSILSLADAQITFQADSVSTGAVNLGRTRLGLTVDTARAVFDLREVQVFDGTLSGEFVVNGRNGLSVRGNLQGNGIAMRPLLARSVGYDRLLASANGQISFLSSGNSVAAIMNSLSGEGAIALGRGEIQGLDLLGMLRRLDPSYVGEGASTIFDSVTASFTMQEGILRNDDLVLTAPLLRASGSGRIGIGQRTLDYRLVPVALTGQDGTGGVRVPVQITGPWADPSIRLDLEALAKEHLEDERQELEARVEAEAERALNRLGVERQEGERLEDAARRGLEEEARRRIKEEIGRGLRSLFGGN